RRLWTVMPAKAGIQFPERGRTWELDSRFRGNDTARLRPKSYAASDGAAWMAGTSLAMTVERLSVRSPPHLRHSQRPRMRRPRRPVGAQQKARGFRRRLFVEPVSRNYRFDDGM
ncbi:MAG: hypothetical protein KGM42_15080, partial [Hyphomicrobiales bacterium]|nr:hypothetical protein [Hyphomicrobiales bacterium]